jgi:aminoglycoside/choline kinase family phosphotransferase
MIDHIKDIKELYMQSFGKEPESIVALPPSGSSRKYYRISYENNSCIAAFNEDFKENRAFISFTKSFLSHGLPVPQILGENLDKHIYLLEDLGNNTLLSHIEGNLESGLQLGDVDLYKKVLDHLPVFQVIGGKDIDYSVCYPRNAFDKQSMMWDLNYFKYYFLKMAQIPFDEQLLEIDFERFCDYLLQTDCNHFLYRDFQSRNVMIKDGKPYFIDYQGGRKGALQYDIASMLFEAKTHLKPEVRQELYEYYISVLKKYHSFDEEKFTSHYYAYIYIRLMQAMGAYGFRGLYERKELFLQSIPKALEHLRWLRENVKLPLNMPQLERVWDFLIENEHIRNLAKTPNHLTIHISSFSYKEGIPSDSSVHGGGFVFDCRALENPGRYDEYKTLTGKDAEVIKFLESKSDVQTFFAHVSSIINHSVTTYQKREFDYLVVNFGCTGGQHRSVYMAEKLAQYLKKQFNHIKIDLQHRQLNKIKAQ